MTNLPESTDAGSYADIQTEVNKHFSGSWERFLKAVTNPGEILQFVFSSHLGKDTAKFEAWAQRQSIPSDWLPRFYSMLDDEGELRPEASELEQKAAAERAQGESAPPQPEAEADSEPSATAEHPNES